MFNDNLQFAITILCCEIKKRTKMRIWEEKKHNNKLLSNYGKIPRKNNKHLAFIYNKQTL